MRAVIVSEYGGTPVLGEIPAPEPGAGQVLQAGIGWISACKGTT